LSLNISISSLCCPRVFKNISFPSQNGITTLASIFSTILGAFFVPVTKRTSTSQKNDITSSFISKSS